MVIRQSAVLPSDYGMPKKWREVYIAQWLKKKEELVELWCSSFDHYSKSQRRIEQHQRHQFAVKLFKTPGYSKNISMKRVIDAWIFSIKVFCSLCLRVKRNDLVICSIPTPESAFAVSLAKTIVGFTLVFDVRDNWMTLGGNGIVSKLFNIYNFLLLFPAINSAEGLSGFSQKYITEHLEKCSTKKNKQSIKSVNLVTKSGFLPTEKNEKIETVDFLFFGSLNEQFSFKLLEQHRETILREFPNVRFVIYGGGANLNKLKYTFADSKNIVIKGHHAFEDVAKHAMMASGFFCFYDDIEQFSGHITNKIVEYLEFEKPIIHNFTKLPVFNGHELYLGPSVSDHGLVGCLQAVMDNNIGSEVDYEIINEENNRKNFSKFIDSLNNEK